MTLVFLSRVAFYPTLLAVSLLSVLPQEQVVISTGWDKANHALAFFVLLALLDHAYPTAHLWWKKLLPLLAYGVVIELLQSQIPGRYASGLDVFGDIVGLLAYLLIRPVILNHIPFVDADQFR
ncbi:VanZ family protein [Oceanicoccus sagamiensis]|uniref:VanZ family protein n=1 Tax=Oceanicoccus sagamiensis TaxID=716816 RepID=UPI000A26A8ED|nr:VanZ family protein [Oceanicoccus sagamiensis]